MAGGNVCPARATADKSSWGVHEPHQGLTVHINVEDDQGGLFEIPFLWCKCCGSLYSDE